MQLATAFAIADASARVEGHEPYNRRPWNARWVEWTRGARVRAKAQRRFASSSAGELDKTAAYYRDCKKGW